MCLYVGHSYTQTNTHTPNTSMHTRNAPTVLLKWKIRLSEATGEVHRRKEKADQLSKMKMSTLLMKTNSVTFHSYKYSATLCTVFRVTYATQMCTIILYT